MSAEPIAVRALQEVTSNGHAANGHAGNGSGEAGDANGASRVEMVMRRMEDKEPLALYVFKTMVDSVLRGGFLFLRW